MPSDGKQIWVNVLLTFLCTLVSGFIEFLSTQGKFWNRRLFIASVTQPNKKKRNFFYMRFFNRLYIFGTCWFQICNRFFRIGSSFWDIQNFSFFMFWDILHAFLVFFQSELLECYLVNVIYLLYIFEWIKIHSSVQLRFISVKNHLKYQFLGFFFGKNEIFKYFEKMKGIRVFGQLHLI